MGAGNPEGVARLMECVIASYSNDNAIAIDDQKHKDDFGWTDEMIEMRNDVLRLTQENPVRDVYGGLPDDTANLISDSTGQPLNGNDWYSTKESINDTVQFQIDEVNAQIANIK